MDQSDGLATSRLALRQAGPEDLAFIFSTWLKSYFYNSPAALHVQPDLYFAKQHDVASQILSRSVVPVACLKDSPNVIMGFAVLEMTPPICIHYVYVKLAWRKQGVAKLLLGNINPNTCVYSHWTSALKTWAKAKWPHLQYDPYLQHSR